MKKKIKYVLLLMRGIFYLTGPTLFYSCEPALNKKQEVVLEKKYSTELSDFKSSLPQGDGVELVETNCRICHSLEYINTQPDFPRKTWEKIVDKMIKSFGAPVGDSTARNAIVNYLVNTKGKK